MTRTFMCVLAVVLLAVCLLSGCSSSDSQGLKSWQDLLKPGTQTQKQEAQQDNAQAVETQNPVVETVKVKLYFVDTGTKKLVAEERQVEKTRAMARKALEELLKGPEIEKHGAVFPAGTRLLDVNIKADQQICLVNFSSEIESLSAQEGKMLVYSVANTLGQFSSIKGVSFMVEGQTVQTLGQMDLSKPVKPDYKV
ncbi:MAG: GerMN domain-containing protein [Syntrophomonas sp.]